jgi:hypothetical protein
MYLKSRTINCNENRMIIVLEVLLFHRTNDQRGNKILFFEHPMFYFWNWTIYLVNLEYDGDKEKMAVFPNPLLHSVHLLISNEYHWWLVGMLYCVLPSGDVRVMGQQPLSSSSPALRMPFPLTSHPTTMPASHHPTHRMHYPHGSQSSGSEVSIGSVGRPPKPRKQRWVWWYWELRLAKTSNKIWVL